MSSLVWTKTSGLQSWIGTTISIGDSGSQVLFKFDGTYSDTRMYSAFDTSPPTSIWATGDSGLTADRVPMCASAKSSNVHATVCRPKPPGITNSQPVVAKYTSNSALADWTYSFPEVTGSDAHDVYVNPDGTRIVAWTYIESAQGTRVTVLDGATGAVLITQIVATLSAPNMGALSMGGTILFLVANPTIVSFNVITGVVVTKANTVSVVPTGHSVSGDGTTYCVTRAIGRVELFRIVNGFFVLVNTLTPPANAVYKQSKFNYNATLLYLAYIQGPAFLECRFQVWDLVTPGTPKLFEDTITGTGIYSVFTSGIAVSKDGNVAALITSGDQNGLAPEVLVYKLAAGAWALDYTYDLPGSAQSLDLSLDGRHLAVGSKAVHNEQLGSGGQFDLFLLETPDLVLSGVPHVGANYTATFTNATYPAAPATLLSDPLPATSPTTFPTYGTLYLNRLFAHPDQPGGTTSGGGVYTETIDLTSANVGDVTYYQGLITTPRRLGHSWIAVRVLP